MSRVIRFNSRPGSSIRNFSINSQKLILSRQVLFRLIRLANFSQSHNSSPKLTRSYSNFVTNSLEYMKKIDDQQSKLEQASTQDKISLLLDKIAQNKELLYLLASYHCECKKLGIYPDKVEERQVSMKFRLVYLMRLKPIHNAFWEISQLVNISNRQHKLSMNVKDLGLLDPKNFDKKVYQELQRGKFGDTDFRDVETVSFSRPQWKEVTEEVELK